MTFLNHFLLFGLAAMAVPLLLHLVRRQRYRVVRWGAMHLLEGAVSRRARTIRLEQVLLVLVRMALLGLLAVVMARPVVTGRLAGVAPGGGPRAVAVVLDGSYSLGYGGAAEAARAAVTTLLDPRRGAGEVALIIAAERPRVIVAAAQGTSRRALEALEHWRPVHGPPDFAGAVRVAAESLAATAASHREIVVVTDRQRLNWTSARVDALRQTAGALAAEDAPPRITWVLVERDPSRIAELTRPYLAALAPLEPHAVPGERVPVRVAVRGRGEGTAECRASFRVDGVERGVVPFTITGTAGAETILEHVFETPGSHWLEARLSGADAHADQSVVAALRVRDEIPVLIVDGDPAPEPLEAESGYLRLALAPYGGTAARRDPFHPVVRGVDDVRVGDLESCAAVILANTTTLPEPFVAQLERFVRGGGGLLVFGGDRVDASTANRLFYRDGDGLLPVALAATPGVAPVDGPGAAVVAGPAGRALLGAAVRDGLEGVRVTRWLEAATGTHLPAGVDVLLELDTGAPLLLRRAFGRGSVVLCTTSADDAWSNLPLRPFFVPLVERLVLALAAGGEPPRTLSPGEPLVLALDAARAGTDVSLRLPDGTEVTGVAVRRGRRAVFEYRDTLLPGLSLAVPAGGTPEHFAVVADRAESALEETTLAAVRALLAGPGAGKGPPAAKAEEEPLIDVIAGGPGLGEALRARRHGLEVWKPLLAVVIALALLELVVAQWVERRPVRRRRGGVVR